MVECQLPKLEVAGSIPVIRSRMKPESSVFTRTLMLRLGLFWLLL